MDRRIIFAHFTIIKIINTKSLQLSPCSTDLIMLTNSSALCLVPPICSNENYINQVNALAFLIDAY